jgi:hypothetical protein
MDETHFIVNNEKELGQNTPGIIEILEGYLQEISLELAEKTSKRTPPWKASKDDDR